MTAGAWAVAALLAFLLAGGIARGGPVDAPRARGAHKQPTPTTGGLAILAACCAGAALAGTPDRETACALIVAATLGVYAAADDLWDLGAGAKLLAQVVAALAFAGWVGAVTALPFAPGVVVPLAAVLGVAGTALWLVVIGNVVNFMDGADGLVAGSIGVAAAAVAAVALWEREPAIAAAAAALAGANLGFLPWNLGRKLFQGDVGALFSSFALAAMGVLLTARGAASPYLVPLAALPLLVDGLGTLLLRVARREPIWKPHKQHLYHRWLAAGRGGHLALAARVWLLTALTASLAAAAELFAREWTFAVLTGTSAALVAGWAAARRSLSSS